MKRLFLGVLFVLTILASSVAYTMTWDCISIMTCKICVIYDDNGNKIGDYVGCPFSE